MSIPGKVMEQLVLETISRHIKDENICTTQTQFLMSAFSAEEYSWVALKLISC